MFKPDKGLHDTDFLRQQYFKVRKEILENIRTIRLLDSNTHYLLGRQRGQFSGYAEVLESKMPRIKMDGVKGLESKLPEYLSLITSSRGYFPIVDKLGLYSGLKSPIAYGESPKINFDYKGRNYLSGSGLEYRL